MKEKRIKKAVRSDLFTASFYLIFGISIRYFPERFLTYTYYLNILLLTFIGLRDLCIHFFALKKDSLPEGIVNIFLALILITKPFSMVYLIRFGCSAYFLLLTVIHITAFIQRMKDSAGIKWGLVIISIAEMIFSYELFFGSRNSVYFLGRIMGLYFIVYACAMIFDMLAEMFSSGGRKKKRIHLSLPNIFCAFIPKKILSAINRLLKSEDITDDMINLPSVSYYQLEIFIHMADTLFGHVGHVDICYGGKVISYGSYDESSYRLKGMIGDGVIEIVDREKYIRFCLEDAGKHIVSFGITLTTDEEEKLQNKLADIYGNLIPWEPPVVAEHDRNIFQSAKYELDYASSLYEKTGAEFYKFRDGKYSKFKTYFALFTNCATLAREITFHIGLNLFDFSGIITPGTFYEYFNSEYKRSGSFVVARNLYALPENAK